LTRKVGGADYFLTQPIYRAEDGEGFLAKYELQHGAFETGLCWWESCRW